jgi:carboxymethylenebutenolidase
MGELINFATTDDEGVGYLARPDAGHGPGVIVLQEWWGMVPHITDVADRLAAAGFTALVPDLYRGERSSEPDDAMKLMMSMNLERAGADMSGAVDFLRAETGGPVGVVGFCMGGGLALVLACQRPDAITAVVPFYGLIPWPGAIPDYIAMDAAVQGHYAERDSFASPTVARKLEQQLRDLGLDAEIFVYDGTDHAFFNDDRPEVFDAAAASLAWDRSVAFLHTELSRTERPVRRRPARPAGGDDPASSDAHGGAASTMASPGHPRYRGGHFDTNVEEFPWLLEFGAMFKTGWILIGDADDGPAVAVVELGAGVPEDDPHFHNSAQVRYFVRGSIRIGNRWYQPGDIRVQQPGIPYGPEEVGPEGVTQLLFFSDRRGMYPHYRAEVAESHDAQMSGFASLMQSTGVTPH